jgi:hypothetical protein
VRPGKAGEGVDLGLGVVHQRADLGEPGRELVATSSQVAATVLASGWVALGHQSQQVACEVHPAPLMASALEGPFEGGN